MVILTVIKRQEKYFLHFTSTVISSKCVLPDIQLLLPAAYWRQCGISVEGKHIYVFSRMAVVPSSAISPYITHSTESSSDVVFLNNPALECGGGVKSECQADFAPSSVSQVRHCTCFKLAFQTNIPLSNSFLFFHYLL